MTRRQFLATTCAAGAVAALRPSISYSQSNKVLRVRSNSDIQDIDPVNPAAAADQDVMMAVFNKLVSYKPLYGNESADAGWGWELEAATSVEQVDPTHVKFTLMPGVMWTNGFGEMTTEDVKYSFERHGQRESWTAVDWASLKEVEIVDKHNGVLVFNEPFAPLFNSTLPYGSGTIVCKAAVEQLAEKKFTVEPPATAGPYKIESWAPKQKLVLTRHDGWPGPKPAFDRIEISPIDDPKTAEIAYEAGQLDMTGLAASSLPKYQAGLPSGSKMRVYPSLFYEWLGMNVDHEPFDDPRVRKAVQLTIDVDTIIDTAYFGAADRATGIIAPGLPGHRAANKISKPDLDKAKALLAEAGLGDGFKTTLDVHNITDHMSAAQIIQANLAQVGVEVQINSHDSGTFWTLGIEAEGDAWKGVQLIYNRYSMAPDPYWATAWFTPEQIGEWNWERWNNADYGKLHNAAVKETDAKKRHDMYVKMQDMMEESGTYVFVTHNVNAFLYRDWIVPAMRPDGGNLMYRQFRTA
jgi:peptide/nickel transport system substrate-binding protein